MKSHQLPYIATPLGLLLLIAVMFGGKTTDAGTTALPLLTLLLICEFGFLVTGIAAFLGIKQIRSTGFKALYAALTGMCALLALRFAILGFGFWPQT